MYGGRLTSHGLKTRFNVIIPSSRDFGMLTFGCALLIKTGHRGHGQHLLKHQQRHHYQVDGRSDQIETAFQQPLSTRSSRVVAPSDASELVMRKVPGLFWP